MQRDRDRYPPLPDRPLPRSSSFLHGLPPPIPASPRGYYPPSPSLRDVRDAPSPSAGLAGGGLTDPGAWSSNAASSSSMNNNAPATSPPGHDMRPLPSGRNSGHWSPPVPGVSPRYSDRLPSLTDYAPARHGWDGPAAHPQGYAKPEPYRQEDGPVPPYSSAGPPRDQLSSSGGHPPPPGIVNGQMSMARPEPSPIQGVTAPQQSSSSRSSNNSKHAAAPLPDGAEPPKKKKRRQAFSCAECAKRKQKCNRETPCQHCLSRKVPHLCIPSSRLGSPPPRAQKPKTDNGNGDGVRTTKIPGDRPVTSSSGILPTMSVRVSKLEKMMNAVLDRMDGVDSSSLSEWRQFHPQAKDSQDRPPSAQLGRPLPDSGSAGGLSAPAAVARSETNETNDTNTESGEEAWVGGLDRGTASRNPLPRGDENGPIRLGLDYHGTVGEQLEHIVEEGASITLHKSLHDLPAKSLADQLVGFFFEKVNHVRYPIDQRLFRKAYEAVYASRGEITPESVLALPLIFAVLAISLRLVPSDWAGQEEERRKLSLKLFWGAQFGIMISTSLNAENLQLVEARILLGLYLVLVHERRLAEGWLMFRAAVATGLAIGLHRDGTRLRLDPYTVEYRRRLWSYLCHADATYSCLIGRPPTIDPMFYDTLLPSNINMYELEHSATLKSKPLSEPTFATYLILRKRLADIVARIVRSFQRLHGRTQYQDVKHIDAELKKLRDELPPAFKMLNPDKSFDGDLWYLPTHRYYIQTEILHYTIILHRPWFLRQIHNDRYSVSRRACFEAAVTDFKIRQAFHTETPNFFETLLGGSFREFNTAMIAGICLLLEPHSSHASDMWNILANFMSHHPHSADEFSKKEAEIIYTLHKRATALQQADPPKAAHPLETLSSERVSNARTERRGSLAASRPGSAEEGSAPSAGVSAAPTSAIDVDQGLHTPASESGVRQDDQVQVLFDQFMAANSEYDRVAPGVASAYDYGPVGSTHLGAIGVPPPQMATAAVDPNAGQYTWNAGDGVNVVGQPAAPPATHNGFYPAPPAAVPLGADPNSSQFWNTFVDVMFEQTGLM